MSIRPGVLVLATACGLLVGLVVAVLVDPGVTFCADTTDGTSYCRAQGGPDLLAALGAGVVTAACVAVPPDWPLRAWRVRTREWLAHVWSGALMPSGSAGRKPKRW